MLRSVRSPQMYSSVDSGCPVILTVPNSKYTHGPPPRRHSEQLHLVATVGVDGSVRRTAPQWHEPSCMNVSEATKRREAAGSCRLTISRPHPEPHEITRPCNFSCVNKRRQYSDPERLLRVPEPPVMTRCKLRG